MQFNTQERVYFIQKVIEHKRLNSNQYITMNVLQDSITDIIKIRNWIHFLRKSTRTKVEIEMHVLDVPIILLDCYQCARSQRHLHPKRSQDALLHWISELYGACNDQRFQLQARTLN